MSARGDHTRRRGPLHRDTDRTRRGLGPARTEPEPAARARARYSRRLMRRALAAGRQAIRTRKRERRNGWRRRLGLA